MSGSAKTGDAAADAAAAATGRAPPAAGPPRRPDPPRRVGFRSLQASFLTFTLTAVLVIIVAFFAYLEISQYRAAIRHIDEKLVRMLDSGSILLADATHHRDLDKILLLLAPVLGDQDITTVAVDLADGTRLAEHGEPLADVPPGLVRRREITHVEDGDPVRIGWVVAGVTHARVDGALQVRLRNHVVLALLILAATVVSTLVSLRHTVMRPMRRLLDAIRGREAGEPVQPVVWSRDDEFGRLIEAFNDMQRQQEGHQRSIAAALDRAETADRAKTAFLAVISHELRTPLNAIIGFSDLMATTRRRQQAPEDLEFLDQIGDSGRQLLDLVNDILEVTHAYSGSLAIAEDEYSLHRLVAQAMEICEFRFPGRAGSVRNDVPETLPPLFVDGIRLRRAIFHLLANALGHTQPGGEITVAADAGPDGVVLRIEDGGSGIDAETLAVLNEPFSNGAVSWENHGTGSGLGLSYVRSIVHLHDGRFELESAPGEGTTATIRLPAGRCIARKRAASA